MRAAALSPAAAASRRDGGASAWRGFLEDVDRYRIRPRPRLAVILLNQGLWASAVYR